VNAKVEGAVDFSGATIYGRYNLQTVQIGQHLICRKDEDSTKACCFYERVTISGARIGQNVEIVEAQINGPLYMVNSRIEGSLQLRNIHFISSQGLYTDPRIYCDGLEIGDIEITDPPNTGFGRMLDQIRIARYDSKGYVIRSFLANTKYSRSVYLYLEQMLRDSGEDRSADAVYLHMRERDPEYHWSKRDFAPWRWPKKIWHLLLLFFLGYGVRIWRGVVVFIGLLLLSTWLIDTYPQSTSHPMTFVVTAVDTRTSKPTIPFQYNAGTRDIYQWNTLDSFFLALRYHIPLVCSIAESDWQASSRPMGDKIGCLERFKWMTWEHYASFMSIFGWVFFPLLIASWTRYIKKLK
jgi:hypothetical protein